MARRIELLEVKIAATEAAIYIKINLLRSYKRETFYTPKKLDL